MKKFSFIMVGLVAMMATSCNTDFFRTESPSALDESIFAAPVQTEQAIGGMYEILVEAESYRTRLCGPWVSLSTDIECYRGSEVPDYAKYTMTATGNKDITKPGKNPWTYLLTGIERGNLIIDGMNKYADLQKDKSQRYLYGEALTLRAWFYYEMIKLWGDVPYQFEAMDVSDANSIYPTKVDRNLIFDKLRKDLLLAWEMMGMSDTIAWTPAKNNVERMNGEFALGLLARIDLVYAGYALRPDTYVRGGGSASHVQPNLKDDAQRAKLLGEVMWACEKVMKHHGGPAGSKLLSSYEQVFKNICASVTSFDKTESLWELPFANAVRGQLLCRCGLHMDADALGHLKHTYQDPNNVDAHSGRNSKIQVTPMLVYKFEATDTRKFVTFVPWRWCYGKNDKTKSVDVLYNKAEKIGAYSLAKYRYEWLSYDVMSNEDGVNMPVMRYSDIPLMFAEASLGVYNINNGIISMGTAPDFSEHSDYQNLYTGQQCFDAVRQRAFGSAFVSKTLDIQAIQDERALEFCGEHIRKYDLMRWGIFASTLIKAQQEMQYFKAPENIEGTPYEGKIPEEKFYYKYTKVTDDAYCTSSPTEYISEVYGLNLGETDVKLTADGWIAGDLYNGSQADLYACPSDVLEYRQYWPIFTVLISSNANLWNDYGY